MKDYRKIITEFYQNHNPSKVREVDKLLRKYAGNEDELVESLRQKYGSAPRKNYYQIVSDLFRLHNPDKLDEVENLLVKYRGNEEVLISSIKAKYQKAAYVTTEPEETTFLKNENAEEEDGEEVSARETIIDLLKQYAPSKLPMVDSLLTQFKGKHQDLIQALKKKYGSVRARDMGQEDSDNVKTKEPATPQENLTVNRNNFAEESTDSSAHVKVSFWKKRNEEKELQEESPSPGQMGTGKGTSNETAEEEPAESQYERDDTEKSNRSLPWGWLAFSALILLVGAGVVFSMVNKQTVSEYLHAWGFGTEVIKRDTITVSKMETVIERDTLYKCPDGTINDIPCTAIIPQATTSPRAGTVKIQCCALKNKETATGLVADLREKGYMANYIPIEGQNLFRVFVETEEDETERVLSELKKDYKNAFIHNPN